MSIFHRKILTWRRNHKNRKSVADKGQAEGYSNDPMDEVGHEDAGKGRSELVAMRGRVEAGQRRSGEGEKADDSTNAA